MTKEEILEKHIGAPIPLVNDERCTKSIEVAMEEYAKQQAVAFAIAYATSKMDHIDRTPPVDDKMDDRYEWWLKNEGKLGI